MSEKVQVVFEGIDKLSQPAALGHKALGRLGDQANQTGKQMGGMGSAMAGMASGIAKGVVAPIHGIGTAATTAGKAVGGMTNLLGKIGLAGLGIKMLADGIGGLAGGLVSGNAEFERYNVQFGVLLGSADEAKARLEELTKFAATTPFELPEVVRADKVLTSFGLDAKDTAARFGVSAAQIRTTIGDVASGAGVSFEELAITFGKFASGATGESIARFQELGIATREQMASWGLEFSKAGELLTPAREAFTVLEKHVRAKYGGMMQAQSQTFEGMMSNLADWMGQTKRKMMEPVFNVLKDQLNGLLNVLNSPGFQSAMDGFATTMARGVSIAMTGVTKLVSGIKALVGYLGAGNKRDLMREWFGGAGPMIDNVVRGIKGFIGTLRDVGYAIRFAFAFREFDSLAAALKNITGIDLSPVVRGVQGIAESIRVLATGDFRAGIFGLDEDSPVVTTLLNIHGIVKDLVSGAGLGVFADNMREAFGVDISGVLGPLRDLVSILQGGLAGVGAAVRQALSGDIGGALKALFTTITSTRAQLIETLAGWARAFVEWVGPMIPPLLAQLGGLAAQVFDWALAQVPVMLQQFMRWADAVLGWIEPLLVPLGAELMKIASAVLRWASAQVPVLIESLRKWTFALIDWAVKAIPPLMTELGKLLSNVLDWLNAEAPVLAEKLLSEWVPAAIIWVAETIVKLIPELAKLLFAILQWIVTVAVPKLAEFGLKMGWAIVKGSVEGLAKLGGALVDAIGNALRSVRIDVGPFHLSADGFSIDAPAMPAISLPNPFAAAPSPVPATGGASGGWLATPGFANGGAMAVRGLPGVDSVGLAFRVRPHEIVSITPPGRASGQNIYVTVTGNTFLSGDERAAEELARRLKPKIDQLVRL